MIQNVHHKRRTQQSIIVMNEKTVISRKRMAPDSTVHHIPCEVQYTGRAPVSDYFVVNSEQPVREAMLRGRLLQGKEVAFPEGIEGVYLSAGSFHRSGSDAVNGSGPKGDSRCRRFLYEGDAVVHRLHSKGQRRRNHRSLLGMDEGVGCGNLFALRIMCRLTR